MAAASRAFGRLAALAEVLTILVLGNLVGAGAYDLLVPDSIASGRASPELEALAEGLLIVLRLGSAALFGYALLFYRRGLTPAQAGLSRGQLPLAKLVSIGLALGVFTSTPLVVLFAVHKLVPFGTGLAAWWTYAEQDITAAFWITLLGTSVLVPPLVEEILTRGYQRVRLVESYGTMGGVVLTGIVFAVAHTRYLAPDPMLLAFLLALLVASLAWTYVAQRTGSVLPAMIAHAVTNGVGTAVLFDVWLPLAVVLIAAAMLIRPIVSALRQFAADWREDDERGSLWIGLAALGFVLAAGLVLLPTLGRLPTLAAVGAVLLLVTLAHLTFERLHARG